MYYLVYRGEVLAAARFSNFTPVGWRWLPGHVIHFETASNSLPADVDDAFLVDVSGMAWHIEILAVAPSLTVDGVTARLLRQLPAHEEITAKVSGQHRLRFSQSAAA